MPIYVWYCHWDGVYEGRRNLGHNFYLIKRAQNSSSDFESLAHYEYLWRGWHNLGRAEAVAVAPSGRYAAFIADDGSFRLYDVQNCKINILSQAFAGLPEEYTWHESSGTLTVKYYDNHPIKTFRITY